MRRILYSFLLLTVLPPDRLTAQFGPPDTTTGPPKGTTTIGLGVQVLAVDAFNAALRANGLPEMSERGFSTMLSTEVRIGRWEIGVSGGGVSGGEEENSTWRTWASGKALTVGLGFAVVDELKWRIAPSAGIGLTRIAYHVEQIRGGDVDSVLADPLRGTDLDGQTGVWQVGLGIERRIGKRFGQKMGISARVGYVEPFGDSDWRADENDLSDGPRATFGGIYARFGLSVGMPKRRDAIIPTLVSTIPWLSR